jgi:hypothetical protein
MHTLVYVNRQQLAFLGRQTPVGITKQLATLGV